VPLFTVFPANEKAGGEREIKNQTMQTYKFAATACNHDRKPNIFQLHRQLNGEILTEAGFCGEGLSAATAKRRFNKNVQ